jgi:hypothetical protein
MVSHGFTRSLALWLVVIPGLIFSQTFFTVPQNVWRFTVQDLSNTGDWIGAGGKKGIQEEEFVLKGYGLRYFDHTQRNPDGHYSAPFDLYDLDTLGFDFHGNVGQHVRAYNLSYGDSLFDFSTDFFGPDSITVGGLFTEKRHRVLQERVLKIEYGFTNRLTFVFTLPYVTRLTEKRTLSWKAFDIPGLADFIAYQQEAKQRFERALQTHYDAELDLLYSWFYTWEGRYSLLWALNGGSDPISQGIYGSTFNPFAENDTTAITIDSLLQYYYPDYNPSSGVGDVSLGFNFLIWGRPAWSGVRGSSLFGGIQLRLPSAPRLIAYNPEKLDNRGRPKQFSYLPLGEGLTRWSFSLFGEFYRTYLGRLIDITYLVQFSYYSQERVNTPISFLGMNQFHPDSIAQAIGLEYHYRKGNELWGQLTGKVELIPDRLSITAGASLFLSGRDRVYSKDSQWDAWQVRRIRGDRTVHDTRKYQLGQEVKITFHNVNALKKFGPIPFEIDIGAKWSIFTRHTFNTRVLWVGLTSYFQAW